MKTPAMQRRQLLKSALPLVPLVWPGQAPGHEVQAGALQIVHVYSVPTLPGATEGNAYIQAIRNPGPKADRLLAASAPLVAGRVVLMRGKRPLRALEIPAGGEAAVQPGGPVSLVLKDLKRRLVVAEQFNLLLTFERAGVVTTKMWVQPPGAPPEKQ
jgi:periplasmic copper chaperone A